MSTRGAAVENAMDSNNNPLKTFVDSENNHFSAIEEQTPMQGTSLRQAIDQALARYFKDLDGTEPNDLYAMVLQQVEQPLLQRVLDYTGGNQSRAAEILGINRSTLRKKLRQHGLVD
ncbi:DNA-binding protein Fis [Natronospira proteinivora]|uniref:Putative Fis-like DNA-binding protein n=2 Tax=Natronospira proteinivora TaxID=1807133 RepID=A0ABT1GF95_9GAMM|nr:DNA-binding transcriptional regulator Fis [Natronospira proteinivora]MCP1728602.1 DNA-binding protein Fis [Natronospira proteinivora]